MHFTYIYIFFIRINFHTGKLLKFVGIFVMALQGPFVRLEYEQHPRHLTQHGDFYYLFARGGARKNVGRSVD